MRSLSLALLTSAVLVLTACGGDRTMEAAGDDDRAPADTAPPATGTEPAVDDPDQPAEDTEPPSPVGSGPYPIADLTFVVDAGDGTLTTYRLACLGDTATFTGDTTRSAERACLALTAPETRNRLLRDDHLQDPCTMQYGGPQTATISGVLEGQVVETTVDRADGCGIHAWGVSLAALLPEPV